MESAVDTANSVELDTAVSLDAAQNAREDVDSTEQNEEEELAQLLMQKQHLQEVVKEQEEDQERIKLEIMQHIEDVQNNLNIFTTWAKDNVAKPNLYVLFYNNFGVEYRISLFENICEFFKDDSFVTDEILFYWKCIVVSLLQTSKKHKSSLDDLEFDINALQTNLRMVREKYIYRCFIGEEPICYFKENGTDYYVS